MSILTGLTGVFSKALVSFLKIQPTSPLRLYTTVAVPMADVVPTDLSATVPLNDGHKIPFFGLGVYKMGTGAGEEGERAVIAALQNGYRLIDTAQYYGNEEDVGRGVKASGIPRSEVFVVTKIWDLGYDKCKKSFMESFNKLNLDYVDLFLIHSPKGGKVLETYDAMLEFQKQGLIRSVGVSNFGVEHLEEMRKAGKPTPAVNQIELHPYLQQRDIVRYCREKGIAVMGFTPLTRGKKFDDPPLVAVAKKHNKSPAQVLLRWSIQKGYITIPKSAKPERIVTNAQIYDFSLDGRDLASLDQCPKERMTAVRTDDPWID